MTGARVIPLTLLVLAACGDDDARPAAAGALPPAPPVRATQLTFAAASYSGQSVERNLEPLVRHLSATLGIPVRLRMAEPYLELAQLVRSGEVDAAQLPAIAYVRLAESLPGLQRVATPIVGGSPTYVGHVYVRNDSPYRTLAELKGARIAWVSEESGSGYLFPRDLLRRQGLDPHTFFAASSFAGSHPAVLEAVRAGAVDAGASFDTTTDWTGTLARPEDLRVVAKTERIPNDCIVARPGYDKGAVEALARALVALRPGAPGADEVLSTVKVNGWVRADEARYDRVRAVLAREASR